MNLRSPGWDRQARSTAARRLGPAFSNRLVAVLRVTLLLLAAAVAMPGCRRPEPAAGLVLPDSVTDLDGHRWTLREPGLRGVALVFYLQDCPVANGYAPRIERLHQEFAGRSVRLLVVQADPRASVETLRQHAREHRWTVPVVADPRHELVRAAGAASAPQAIVWDARGRLVYSGRIDDQFVDWGKKRPEPTRNDLREVLEKLAEGREMAATTTPVVGCYLKDLRPIPTPPAR